MPGPLIGFDIGGQSVKAVLVDAEVNVTARGRRSTGTDTTVGSLATVIRELLDELLEGGRPEALGVGIAGVIGTSGKLEGSPNMPALIGHSIAEELSALIGVRAVVENDANCAAYAEGWHGAADGVRDYLVVTLGTGLGSGVVLGGELFRGSTGYACELGHSIVQAGGRQCGCGNLGCLEAYASEAAMRSILSERDDELTAAVLGRVDEEKEGYTQALYSLAAGASTDRSIEPMARGVVEEMIRMLGIGLASAVNVLDLETIVIAGGIAPSVVSRMVSLRAAMQSALFARSIDAVSLLASVHGDDAGAIGAARLGGVAL